MICLWIQRHVIPTHQLKTVLIDIELKQGLARVNGEVVIVDDASTDNSTLIVEEFMDQNGEFAGQKNFFADGMLHR